MYDNIEFLICAGGECTRNFPHSKAIAHKCLLPMGDIRMIDHTLQDIIRMGGRHITFVCSNQKVVDDFKHALATDKRVEEKLRAKGKDDIADVLANTFLPDDVDLKFAIQPEPLGTADVIYEAREAIQGRHVMLIFPDDIIVSQDKDNTHFKKITDAFLENEKRVLLTGLWREDVSNNAILVNNRIVEKPKNPTSHIAGMSPNMLPNAVIQYLVAQAPEKLAEARETKKEWLYMDAVNDFLDNGGEAEGYSVDMFLKSDDDKMLDTGNLMLYEQCLLEMLLKHSVYAEKNRETAQRLLQE